MIKPGGTLLIETNFNEGGYIQSHLFIIVLETDDHLTIIIPIDTIRGPKFDRQMILNIGCHEFITHDSYINYRRARIISTVDLENMISSGKAKIRASFTEKLLEKVRDGILKSDFTPMEIRDIYSSHLFKSI